MEGKCGVISGAEAVHHDGDRVGARAIAQLRGADLEAEFLDGKPEAFARLFLDSELGLNVGRPGQGGEFGQDAVEAGQLVDLGQTIEASSLKQGMAFGVYLLTGPGMGFVPALHPAGDRPFAPEAVLLGFT